LYIYIYLANRLNVNRCSRKRENWASSIAPRAFQHWIVDLASPGILRLLQKNMDPSRRQGGCSLKFGSEQGPELFLPYGWKPIDVRSPLKTAARFKRLSLGMRLLSLLPQSNGRQDSRPWSGICLFAKL
jgi:hypothetical protein